MDRKQVFKKVRETLATGGYNLIDDTAVESLKPNYPSPESATKFDRFKEVLETGGFSLVFGSRYDVPEATEQKTEQTE